MSRKANFSTHEGELAPETDSCNRFAPWSLLPHIKPVQIVGADVGALLPGACCRSVLREQVPSCLPAFKEKMGRLHEILVLSPMCL